MSTKSILNPLKYFLGFLMNISHSFVPVGVCKMIQSLCSCQMPSITSSSSGLFVFVFPKLSSHNCAFSSSINTICTWFLSSVTLASDIREWRWVIYACRSPQEADCGGKGGSWIWYFGNASVIGALSTWVRIEGSCAGMGCAAWVVVFLSPFWLLPYKA